MNLIHSNDFVAVFFVGLTLAWDNWIIEQTRELKFQETIDLFFTISFFILFGIHFPWGEVNEISKTAIIFLIILIMLFRRLPAVLALFKFIPDIKTLQEAIFVGWFGPIGVGALFYAYSAAEEHYNACSKLLYPLICAVVMGSVLLHGVTVPLFHMTLIRASVFERVIVFIRTDHQ